MALVIKDRVKEGTTTTGTGDITLAGAGATFSPFNSHMTNGDTTYYAIVHTSSGVDEWEVGLGTWNTGNTLSRTTILGGSNGTSAVDFSGGTKNVFMTAPASKLMTANADGSLMLPDGLTVMGKIDGATYIEAETHLDLNTTTLNKPTHREGRIFYDAAFGALAVYNDEADVTLQVGQEEYIRVKNNTGSTITNGTPVYLTGEDQSTPTIAPAKADGTYLESQAVAVATHDIENNTIGYVTTRGLIADVDTAHLTVGQAVHVAVGGGTQTATPTYPYYATEVGICLISAATGGCIYVSPRSEAAQSLRVTGNAYFDTNVTIAGDLTVLGDQTVATSSNIAIGNAWNYFNAGDTIGALNTAFSGTGLDDATLTGHFTGTSPTSYYVRIDGVGTGTGGVDTFEWSTDNFVTTVATGVDITGDDQLIHSTDNIAIKFESTTGHTLGDTWTGTASPVNVDTGFASNRNTGTTGVGYTHLGIFYDVSTNKWTVFDAYSPEPEGAIDITHPSFSYGTLKAGTFEGDLTGAVTGNVTGNVSGNVTGSLTGNVTGDVTGNLTGNVTGNADTATKLATARTVQLSGDVTGSATFDGSANINITATVGDDSHAHVIANVDGLQAALDAKADDSTTITAGNGLTGGGTLGVNTTLSVGAGTGVIVNADNVAIGQDVATTATPTFAGGTYTGDVSWGDNDKAIFGAGSDLQIYHDGATNHSIINEIGTGNLKLQGTNVVIEASNGTATQAEFFAGDANRFYYNNALKLATTSTGIDVTGNISVSGTVDGRDVSTDGAKLDGIEAGATGDQTAAEIRALVEAATDSNVFTDADHTKLNGIEAGATADQTASEILTAIKTVDGSGSGLDADTLDGVQGSSFLRSDADDTSTGRITFSNVADTQITVTGGGSSWGGITFADANGSDNIYFWGSTGTFAIGGGGSTVSGKKLHVDGGMSVGVNADTTAMPTNGIFSEGAISVGGNTVWHQGNDGSGSGLDADLLDGVQGSSFLRSDTADSFTGNLTASGDTTITYGPNSGWGKYLRVGGNGWGTGDTTTASIAVTDGNLHMDCVSGSHGMYLNYYAGTGGIKFGNGALGVVGTTDSSGNLTMNGNVTAYSDERLKDNVEVIESALDKVSSIRGVTYNRNDMEGMPRHAGVIAQEVEKVLPEVVMTSEDGIKTVAYGNMVGLLIEAIKEQQAQIDELKAKLGD